MTEEEEKAIKRLEDVIFTNGNYEKIILYKAGIDDMQIILNLIQKLQKEIEEIKQYWQWDLENLQEYHKIASDLKYECTSLTYKLEKKDKIIDEMAEDLMVCDGGLTFIDIGTSNGNFKEDKEKMIRCYEKKVEENDYEK